MILYNSLRSQERSQRLETRRPPCARPAGQPSEGLGDLGVPATMT